VCAVGRVYTTATLDYDGEALYQVCALFLWGVGAVTCLSMVFSVHAAPVAFKGKGGFATKLVQSLSSWRRMTSKASRDPSVTPKSSRRQRIEPNGETSDANLYRQAHDVPLKIYATGPGQDARPAFDSANVVKTNEITVEQDAAMQDLHDQSFNRQHPWMADDEAHTRGWQASNKW
jgi:hypothetical protein